MYQGDGIDLLSLTNQLCPHFKELCWHIYYLHFSHFGTQWREKCSPTKTNVNFKIHEQKYQLQYLLLGSQQALVIQGGSLFLSCCQSSFFQFLKVTSIFIFTQSKHILLISSSHSSNSSKSSDLIPFLSTSFFLP